MFLSEDERRRRDTEFEKEIVEWEDFWPEAEQRQQEKRREKAFRVAVREGRVPEGIEITLDGQSISGRIVFLAPNDIVIEIMAPFDGFRSGLHIPYFAMGDHSRHFMADGRISDRGKRTAQDTLKEIYVACADFTQNLPEIKAKFLESRAMAPPYLSAYFTGKKNIGEILNEMDGYLVFLRERFGICGLDLIAQLTTHFLIPSNRREG